MPPQEPQQPNPTPTEPVAPAPAPEVQTAPQPAPAPEPATNANPAPASNEDPGHTMGIIGLVLVFFMPLAGLIVSIIARSKSKKAGHNNTLATVGIIVNLFFMLISLIAVVFLVFATMKGVQTASLDVEAQSDISAQAGQLESYYAKNGSYPSSVEALMPDVTPESLEAPAGYTYTYTPTPAGCTECTGYTLETQLSTGDVYRKEALNEL